MKEGISLRRHQDKELWPEPESVKVQVWFEEGEETVSTIRAIRANVQKDSARKITASIFNGLFMKKFSRSYLEFLTF